ncbi:hypothetical protein [Streptomyces platensis]|uniref:hypothetical protein n=1 Tax=Streptomyces platensis TaxID=58346 RepID=UPI003863A381
MFAGKTGDGLAVQVRGAYGGGLRCRDDWASAALVALRLGGPQPVVRQLALEVALEFAGGGDAAGYLFTLAAAQIPL